MHKKRFIRNLGILITIIVLGAMTYSIINFKILEHEISGSVQVGGISMLFLFVFLLELMPNVIGIEPPVFTAIVSEISWVYIAAYSFVAIVLANLVSFFVGYRISEYIKGFIEAENLRKYEELWYKYGKITMIITAISPIPYIPTIAGLFKMKPSFFFTAVLGARLARHVVVIGAMLLLLA